MIEVTADTQIIVLHFSDAKKHIEWQVVKVSDRDDVRRQFESLLLAQAAGP